MQIEHALSRRSALGLAGAAGLATILPRSAAAQNATAPPASAPAAATTPYPGFYRFKIGKIEATVLSDGWASMTPLHPMFAPETTRPELERVLRENFQPIDHAAFEFNPALLKIGSERLLIDTGSGSGAPRPLGGLLDNLRASGVQPDEITAVLITHAHGDHIGGVLAPGGGLTFPKARYFIARSEYAFWTAPSPDLSKSALPEARRKGMVETAAGSIAAIDRKLERIAAGDKTLPGIEVLDTNGHTPGHLSLLIADGPDQLLVSADLMHNHVIMFARPDWTVAFDTDPRQAASTRKRMFDRIASERLRVLGYHVPWPGLGNIRKREAGFEWVPEAWAWTA
jgi:glyoxylase-like metal-dependent hydrolase (beta-lactamase superfamily II)